MTNTKTRKSGKLSAKSKAANTTDEDVEELYGADSNLFMSESEEIMLSEDTEVDDEDCVNDSDTGTSFSLEECMNEFRARRNRRISLHGRPDAVKCRDDDKCPDVTEMDLINQNLCNKEQERKCKPCKNGFCYCFTSDSGDGAGSVVAMAGCRAARAGHVRHSRRYRRLEFVQAAEDTKDCRASVGDERNSKSIPENSRPQKNLKLRSVSSEAAGKSQLTAISRLETSHRDDPLIHIVQELRDNCVISEVRVNKQKLRAKQAIHYSPRMWSENKAASELKTSDKVHQTSANIIPIGRQEPTAPDWDSVSKSGMPLTDYLISSHLEYGISKNTRQKNRRSVAGGRLLQKRLSCQNFSYKPPDTKEPPQKPPRSSTSLEEYASTCTTSTSLSVREAERVVDEFLAEKGYTIPMISKDKPKEANFKLRLNAKSTKETCINKDKLLTKKRIGETTATYPSLEDIERIIESKRPSHYENNIRNSESQPKVFRIGWKEPRINYMLNYDSNHSPKAFHTSSTQAEPQQCAEAGVLREAGIGWQIPQKIDLDTVDGEELHNLASNVENKDTPVKSKLVGPKTSGKTSQKQRIIWSEQLRNFSPWSNKKKIANQTNSPKINTRSSSKEFLKSSTKKILRLVSPKKENKDRLNFQIRKTPHRHVAIQTSREFLGHHQYPRSPPGSYHSPVQSSQLQPVSFDQSHSTTLHRVIPSQQHFDFSRHIHSPSKTVRPSQRKLYFPLNCAESRSGVPCSPPLIEMETYRSFNGDLDKDLSLSKMSYVLSNIRAKLEANDNLADQTFRETERGGDCQLTNEMDIVDGRQDMRQEPPLGVHSNLWPESEKRAERRNDPIYSEIDEDSIHISESPNFDNHTGIQHFKINHNPEVVYAQVDKSKKRISNPTNFTAKATALGKILHDSIKSKRSMSKTPFLPPLPEPPGGETVSYSSATSLCKQQSHYQSLNNVRVMEHDSPPKRQTNLSKSDLSLHRSEIFLENLCKSELLVTNLGLGRPQKIENDKPNHLQMSLNHTTDNANNYASVTEQSTEVAESYDLPTGYGYDESVRMDSTLTGSNLGLSSVDPPLRDNQSTPTKPSFSTKDECEDLQIYEESLPGDRHRFTGNLNTSCPNPLNKHYECDINSCKTIPHCESFSENSPCRRTTKEMKPINTLPGLKHMQFALRKSIRKGKKFIKSESKRLSTSLNFAGVNSDAVNLKDSKTNRELIFRSSFDLASLFSLNQSASVDEQLTKVVHICRNLPDLENSTEMVEAERLLLFSKLRREKHDSINTLPYLTMDQRPMLRFFIDDMFLPVRADVDQDIFFNYFYIVTFECGGIIRSTQSAECQNAVVVFRDCGIEFFSDPGDEMINEDQNIVRCNIFMLRLRKVSTLSLEPTKKKHPESVKRTSVSSASSSLSDEIVSRFRLISSFTLDSSSFIPYEYVEQESRNRDRICLRASRVCNIHLTSRTKSSNLSLPMQLKGRAEVRFQKRLYSGFLNVEDPFTQHNWNRRWCTLDGFELNVWDGANNLNEAPLLSLDLRCGQQHTLYPAPRELCARPRSFCLNGMIRTTNEEVSDAAIYFAAETQQDVSTWLEKLNFALDFIKRWLVQP